MLSTAGIDFSNETQASDFLQNLLDDSIFQIDANAVARKFWYGIVVSIGVASLCHILWQLTLWTRLRASHANPGRTVPWTKLLAALTGIVRIISYLQFTPQTRTSWFKIPPLGTVLVIVAYLAFALALQFINNDVPGPQWYTAVGVRAGWLAVAQVPLLVLLAGKNNLIGLLSGTSYERLNVYHRWVARGLLLLATFHFGFLGYSWNQYGIMQLEWTTDTAPPTGIATYAILLWMNLSTLAPLRNWCYEFFVIQHIITFFGFIIAVMFHIPGSAKYARVYIYIPIALYLVERLVYLIRYLVNNIRPSRATLEALEGGATKIRVSSRQIRTWIPGTHVQLSIPFCGSSHHPATIMSTPRSHNGELVFILRAYQGFTKRLLKVAQEAPQSSSSSSLSAEQPEKGPTVSQSSPCQAYLTLIDGPYGSSHKDFACYDTLFLIAGATGVTFTLSVLLDLAERSKAVVEQQGPGRRLPVRVIQFVWIIKQRSWQTWISEELLSAGTELIKAGIEFSVRVYVTRDDGVEEQGVDDIDAIRKASGTADGVLIGTEKTSAEIGTMPPYNAELHLNRPVFDGVFWDVISRAEGESAVAVCGPLSLSMAVRRSLGKIPSNPTGHGIYLHVESFT